MLHGASCNEGMQMHQLPETGFLRLYQIIGDLRRDPPVKKSCWWAGVKDGRFPKPVKLGSRVTVWRVEDIRSLIEAGRWCHRLGGSGEGWS